MANNLLIERGTSVDPESLLARVEKYVAEVPTGVGVLVAAVDVQDNRLEVQVKGYGAGEESWLIAYEQIPGDPGQLAVWSELDVFLRTRFRHESGQELPIECTTVDSGGHHTDDVYRYCKAREGRRIYAIRGGNTQGSELVTKASTKNRYRVLLFTICVDTAKDKIYSRLRIPAPAAGCPSPGYLHLPDWVTQDYCDQLTAEKAFRKWDRRRGSIRFWKKIRERNEALDLEVYCLAALHIGGPGLLRSLPERAARWDVPAPPGGETPPACVATAERSSSLHGRWALDGTCRKAAHARKGTA